MADISQRAREAGGDKRIYLVAENEPQDTNLVRPRSQGGYGLDALWNDDYHHSAAVALTGRREAYYTDYKGSAQELISCAKYGYLYQGQWYGWQKQARAARPVSISLPHAFVAYLENHDQVANSAFGRRLHQMSSPARHRALTALTLLGPATPLLFQGQEFASSAPFLFFADHREELRESIRRGRREFLAQFPSLSDPDVANALPSPVDEATFEKCKLDLSERETHAGAYALHRDLLRLRRADAVIARAAPGRRRGHRTGGIRAAILWRGGGSAPRRQPRRRSGSDPGAGTVARAAARSTVVRDLEQRVRAIRRDRDTGARPPRRSGTSPAEPPCCSGRPPPRAPIPARSGERAGGDGRRLMAQTRMQTSLTRTIDRPRDRPPADPMPRREWLVTNGLGGYASGTVAGVVTRRYHGLLIASLPAPLGRMVMFNHLLERIRLADRRVLWLGDEDEVAGPNAADRTEHLVEFRLELGLPVWTYEIDGLTLEKRRLDAARPEHGARHLPSAAEARVPCGCRCVRRSTSARTNRS